MGRVTGRVIGTFLYPKIPLYIKVFMKNDEIQKIIDETHPRFFMKHRDVKKSTKRSKPATVSIPVTSFNIGTIEEGKYTVLFFEEDE
jgi:hypothetical protein